MKSVCMMIGILILGIINPIFSKEEACGSYKKIYVSPENLVIMKEGIFVRFADEWFQTSGVEHDLQGIFITKLKTLDKNALSTDWICPKCETDNPGWLGTCRRTGCLTRKP